LLSAAERRSNRFPPAINSLSLSLSPARSWNGWCTQVVFVFCFVSPGLSVAEDSRQCLTTAAGVDPVVRQRKKHNGKIFAAPRRNGKK
jgi:hypothetical protein